MKRFLVSLILMFVMVATGSFAMLIEVPLNQMIAESDLVVFGKVVDTKNVGKNKDGFDVVANLFEISQDAIKGSVKSGEKIKIKTFSNLEDSSSFIKGEKYLLFLTKQGNHYFVYNGLQGEWIIRLDGKFGGMGTGSSVKDVKKALKEGYKVSAKEPVFKM